MVLRLSLTFLLSSALAAQATFQVGYRDVVLTNPTATGSRKLACRIAYPAVTSGKDAPMVGRIGGWKTCVFLHGFNSLGRQYTELAYRFASKGWILVLSDTAQTDFKLQIEDGKALLPALEWENKRKGSPFYRSMKVDRVALLGHSFGGANIFHVLAANPGYVAGVSYSPYLGKNTDYVKKVAPLIRVPMLVIGGAGEKIAPWKTHAKASFDQLSSFLRFKIFYLCNQNADHYNLVAWVLRAKKVDREVFDNSQDIAQSFLEFVQHGDPMAIDEFAGPTARREKHFQALESDVEEPLYFRTGSDKIGGRVEFHTIARLGLAVHWFAFRPSLLQTPFGVLRLDPLSLSLLGQTLVPANGWSRSGLVLPNSSSLRGLKIYFQVLAAGRKGYRFGNSISLTIR
ncbi:MAG TPA: hypothetical protein ENK02_11255 [Planctomycetes bacterium]|nr:hypothetical protein [Planctomycetota bacterium]